MFWFPLLPPIPLVIYKELNSPMVVMARFVFFQFATVIWLEMRKSACSTVSPACWASRASAAPWPHPEHCWLLWKQHSTTLWRTGRCWGDYSSFDRDIPVLSCKLTPRMISLGLSGHISFALWKPQGLWLFASYEAVQEQEILYIWINFPTELHCSISLSFLYVVGQYFSTCFAMFSSRR